MDLNHFYCGIWIPIELRALYQLDRNPRLDPDQDQDQAQEQCFYSPNFIFKNTQSKSASLVLSSGKRRNL